MSQARKIIIVGGTGKVGQSTANALASHSAKHLVTVTTRSGSKSSVSFPPQVEVVSGNYEDEQFFVDTFRGQDIVVIALGFMAEAELHSRIIKAAAEAKVQWILPCEFGSDNSRPAVSDILPFTAVKKQYRAQIESAGVSSWIGVVTNPWLTLPWLSSTLNVQEKTATFFDQGNYKSITTTLHKVGLSVAALVSLPKDQLAKHRNSWVYCMSFRITQRELLDSIQRVTGTKDEDWTIDHLPLEQVIQTGQEQLKAGDMRGAQAVLFGSMFKPGFGGDFAVDRPLLDDELDLKKEDLDTCIRQLIEENRG